MKTKSAKQLHLEFLYGEENANKPMYRTVYETHVERVYHCDYCGASMTRSERNDFGSLCERCYMREYYGY